MSTFCFSWPNTFHFSNLIQSDVKKTGSGDSRNRKVFGKFKNFFAFLVVFESVKVSFYGRNFPRTIASISFVILYSPANHECERKFEWEYLTLFVPF